jgi:protein TonB
MKHNKTPEANLAPKRKVYFQLGFAVALSLVLAAFEWTGYDSQEYSSINNAGDPMMEEEIIPFNRPEKPTPPKPKTNTTVFTPVVVMPVVGDPGPELDPFALNFDVLFDFGDPGEEWTGDSELPPLPLMRAEIMPFYDQCKNVLDREEQSLCTELEIIKYVQSKVVYPRLCVDAGIEGTVYVSFVIDRTGQIRDAKIERGLHKQIDTNCLAAVNSIPQMNPASQQGKAVSVYYNIPISFKLAR